MAPQIDTLRQFLPSEMQEKIIHHMSAASLAKMGCVDKYWKAMSAASDKWSFIVAGETGLPRQHLQEIIAQHRKPYFEARHRALSNGLHDGSCPSLPTIFESDAYAAAKAEDLERQLTQWAAESPDNAPIAQRLRDAKTGGQVECWFNFVRAGSIPEWFVDYLPDLKRLAITSCYYQRPLPSLTRLRHLEFLSWTFGLQLSALPEDLGVLRKLRDLIIVECPVTRLPDSIGDLENLQTLRLDGCLQLTELPASLGRLRNLRRLCLADSGVAQAPLPAGLDTLEGLVVER